MIQYLFITIILCTGCFFIGLRVGKGREDDYNRKEIYNIEFDKTVNNGTTYKSSYLINIIMNFCDKTGIDVLKLEISDWGRGNLKVRCNKTQRFLLINELTDLKNGITVKNIGDSL